MKKAILVFCALLLGDIAVGEHDEQHERHVHPDTLRRIFNDYLKGGQPVIDDYLDFYRGQTHVEKVLGQMRKCDLKAFKDNPIDRNNNIPYVGLYQIGAREKDSDEYYGYGERCYKIAVAQNGRDFVELDYGSWFFKYKTRHLRKPWTFSACFGSDLFTTNNEVLLFFHGVTGNPTQWRSRLATSTLRRMWRERQDLPRVVSLSMGPVTSFADPGVEKNFDDFVLPYVKRKLIELYDVKMKTVKMLGVSMGGYNATHLTLSKPNLFEKVGLVCPALSILDDKSRDRAFENYILRTAAMRPFVAFARYMMPRDFAPHNPLLIGQSRLGKHTPPLHIQTSSFDMFGFEEGGELFAMLATINNVPSVSYKKLQGGHCVVDANRLISFYLDL